MRFYAIFALSLVFLICGCEKHDNNSYSINLQEYLPSDENMTLVYTVDDKEQKGIFTKYKIITKRENNCVYFDNYTKINIDLGEQANSVFAKGKKLKEKSTKLCADKDKFYIDDKNSPTVDAKKPWNTIYAEYQDGKATNKKPARCEIIKRGIFEFKNKSYQSLTTQCGIKNYKVRETYAKGLGLVKTEQFVNNLSLGDMRLRQIKFP